MNGFNGSVTFSAAGLPGGVTAALNPTSTTSSCTLTLTASSTAALGIFSVTITGASGGLSHSVAISLTIAPPPNFVLSTSPNSLSLARGGNVTSSISVTAQNGFTGSVSLSASGLQHGVTAFFNPASTTGTSTLTLSPNSKAITGTFSIQISGTSGSLTPTTAISLTVHR